MINSIKNINRPRLIYVFFAYNLKIILFYFLGNSKAGWKFWKKDKETTTTMSTTTSVSVNVQNTIAPARTTKITRPTVPIANTEATVIDATDQKLDTTGENIQNNIRSNLKIEFATDTNVSKLNRPGIDHGNVQNYQNLPVDLIEIKEPSQNQASKISQGLTIKSDSEKQPNLFTIIIYMEFIFCFLLIMILSSDSLDRNLYIFNSYYLYMLLLF